MVVVEDWTAWGGGVTAVVTVAASYTVGVPVVASQAVLATTGITHGVQLEAVPPEQAGLVGAVVTYTLRVTNTGNVTDTYDLSASRNLWPVTLVPTSTRVAAQGSADVSVQVTIPVTATVGLTDVVRVMAAGPGVSDYGDLITTAPAPNYRGYLSLMIKKP